MPINVDVNLTGRTRCFAFELYEENAPQNLKEVLSDFHVKTAYALHDKDKYTEADLQKYKKNNDGKLPDWKVGDTKKTHIHTVFKFENVKSMKQVLKMLEPLGVTFVIPVYNERGMIRYLIHLDDKDKYQYSRSDINTLCNYQIDKFFESDKNINEIKQELRFIILKDKSAYTYNYFEFYNYVADNYGCEYLDVIDKYSYSFQSLVNGKNKKKEQDELKKAEEKRIEKQKQHEKEIEELTKEARKQTELRKLELKQKEYDKKEHFKKIYAELKDKANLDANELKLKADIENFFAEYEESYFKNILNE